MSDPRVITFEKDIEEEIRSKAASLTDIASASGYVTSAPKIPNKKPSTFILPSIILICILIGFVGAFYYLQTTKNTTETVSKTSIKTGDSGTQPKQNEVIQPTNASSSQMTNNGEKASAKSPSGSNQRSLLIERESGTTKRLIGRSFSDTFSHVAPFIGSNIIKAETALDSYILTFNSYSETFKKVNDHENEFAEDLKYLYDNGTSTNFVSSSTKQTFNDIRINSIDTRELTYGENKKVYYAFIKPTFLIVSQDKKSIESLAHSLITP